MGPDALPAHRRWPSAESWSLAVDGTVYAWHSDRDHRERRSYTR